MTDLNIIEESNLKCILIWTIATFAGKLNLNKTQLTRHQSCIAFELKTQTFIILYKIRKYIIINLNKGHVCGTFSNQSVNELKFARVQEKLNIFLIVTFF